MFSSLLCLLLLLSFLSVYLSVSSHVQLTSERGKLKEAEKCIRERDGRVGDPSPPTACSMHPPAIFINHFLYLLTGWSKPSPLSDQPESWFAALSQKTPSRCRAIIHYKCMLHNEAIILSTYQAYKQLVMMRPAKMLQNIYNAQLHWKTTSKKVIVVGI